MYKVIYNKRINKNSYEILIEAPMVVEKFIPGQFAIVMAKSDSEKIPLSIYDCDKEKGLLYLIYQVVGASTLELTYITDYIYSVTGPLGMPSEICLNANDYKSKKIVYVGGGVGIAPVYPQVKYLKEHGIDVDVIYGCRNKDLMIIKDKIENVCSNVMYATDDGSFGEKGFVTNILERNIDKYDICIAIGPVIMMKNVCELTKKYNVKTIVSMNPIMVDGSGMCGACRCLIDGKPKFACIHGPEFDGHKVDFESALKRMNTYKEEEKIKFDQMEVLLNGKN
ncbi:MAG: sulfide/dihydroorotate dehydrogenase-like FAD/NAD-binding protein [Bacilli bacterium]|nr:sulfide/dihydroorotate dehydrogenase-like FAD/NAD-binding protein [Bacilli bacterium]